jgi:hypothetical protein
MQRTTHALGITTLVLAALATCFLLYNMVAIIVLEDAVFVDHTINWPITVWFSSTSEESSGVGEHRFRLSSEKTRYALYENICGQTRIPDSRALSGYRLFKGQHP